MKLDKHSASKSPLNLGPKSLTPFSWAEFLFPFCAECQEDTDSNLEEEFANLFQMTFTEGRSCDYLCTVFFFAPGV